MSTRLAVKAVQTVLASTDPAVKVDGLWGPTTERVYSSSDSSVRAAADKASIDNGYPISVIRRTGVGVFVTPGQMREIIRRVSSETGIAEATLQEFLDLEAARAFVNGERCYVANATNSGGYVGLFQFDSGGNAWRAAATSGSLPAFTSNWMDPYYNTLAAALYVKTNTRYIRTKGYKGVVSAPIAYLMHNQGAAGAYAILSGAGKVAGKQSTRAMAVIASAKADFERAKA